MYIKNMTISTTASRIQYTGNGVTTAFSFPYKFFSNSDLIVIITDTLTNADTVKTITTDYTISGTLTAGIYESGGTITFLVAPLSTDRITISRELPLTQLTDYTYADSFPESAHENALDRLVIIGQQFVDKISRSLLLPISTTLSNLTLPSPAANTFLGWNAGANGLENKSNLTGITIPSFNGNANRFVRINATANDLEYRTPAQVRSDIKLTNAGNPNGSITGNYEGELLYDTTNDLLWVYSGSSTVWYSIGGIKSGSLPTNYHDVRVNYTDANTLTVLAGSRLRSSDDTTDIIFIANRTCVLNASGANGLDTGSEAANTAYFLYAIYNPSTLTSALLFSAVDESVSGSIALPSGFTKKRQILVNGIADEQLIIYNNASSDIDYIGGTLIRLNGGNGFGSINTVIRRLLITSRAIGSAATYADSATLGATITINKDGIYQVVYTDFWSAGITYRGISLNSTQLTTSIDAITRADNIASVYSPTAVGAVVTTSQRFKKLDAIRPHAGGGGDAGNPATISFDIARIG